MDDVATSKDVLVTMSICKVCNRITKLYEIGIIGTDINIWKKNDICA